MRLRLMLPIALALTACEAFSSAPADAPGVGGVAPHAVPGSFGGPPRTGGGFGVAGAGGAPAPGFGVFGEVVVSEVPPPPIQGGTLLIARDGHTAIVADPDRDRVVVADLQDAEIQATLELRPGDEPGRLAEDAAGRVHVVLRRAGAMATIDLTTRALVDRRDVCARPQGIAYAASTDSLLVACGEGTVVELPTDGGIRKRVVHVAPDLRDVVVVGERVLVSRFKSAELLELDADLDVVTRGRPGDIAGPFNSGFAMFPEPPDPALSPFTKSFSADVAFRTVVDPKGRVIMLHERAQATEIALQAGDDVHGEDAPSDGMPIDAPPSPEIAAQEGGDPYGGGGGGDMCGSIVRPAVSMTTGGGADTLSSGPVLPAATLAVDAAVSRDGRWLAIAVAGSRNVERTTFGMLNELSAIVMSTDALQATAPDEQGSCPLPGFDSEGGSLTAGQVVAVAFDGNDRLVMQTREPAALQITGGFAGCFGCGTEQYIPLGGAPRADTGHDFFHNDAGAGIACASCHPGGGDDGHTWVFSGLGPRRTQLFNMGIANTLPLHWDGDLPTFADLVKEVFQRRMGGPDLSTAQVAAMGDWIDTLQPEAPLRGPEEAAVQRGQVLFESAEVGCNTCHSGSMLTDNRTVDVGTGGPFQVPSLIGVAHHAPWIHTGCASTLHERFDPACGGGDLHGKTSQLSRSQIDDLVAYLESL